MLFTTEGSLVFQACNDLEQQCKNTIQIVDLFGIYIYR